MEFTKQRSTVSTLIGESNKFSVAVNPKTFSIVFDGLYSNKIKSIMRELCTNAYDSHIAADNVSKPFVVGLPNDLDTTFYVRDYGTSLSHDDIMHLYTTVFKSTKDQSNDFVGQLGLGSKSPFAYTDTFTVEAFLDGTVRTYIASINSEGYPIITFLFENETDEPSGLKVSFTAKRQDFKQFADAMEEVSMGFDTLPDIYGNAVDLPSPLVQGDGYKVYSYQGYGGQISILQGCVLYPVLASKIGTNEVRTTSGHLVIEVPIGTIQTTASREDISYDDTTVKNIINAVDSVIPKAKADIEKYILSQESLFDACRAYEEVYHLRPRRSTTASWNSAANSPLLWKTKWGNKISLSNMVPIWDGPDGQPLPHYVPRLENIAKDEVKSIRVSDVSKCVIILDKALGDRSVKAREKRLRAFVEENRNRFPGRSFERTSFLLRVREATQEQIDYLKRHFKLNDNQFVRIESLPEPSQSSAPKRPTVKNITIHNDDTSLAGVYNTRLQRPTVLANDYFWIPTKGQRVGTNARFNLNGMFWYSTIEGVINKTSSILKALGYEVNDFYLFTDTAIKRLSPPKAKCASNIIESASDDELLLILKSISIHQNLVHYRGGDTLYEILQECFDLKKVSRTTHNIQDPLEKILASKSNIADIYHETRKIKDKVKKESISFLEDIEKKYPLFLVTEDSKNDCIDYINNIKKENEE